MKNQFVGLHLDFIGFTASVLCAIHCVGLPILLSLTPLTGLQFLANPWVEYSIIFFSFMIAASALIHGFLKHLKPLALIIVIAGFILIILGHLSTSETTESTLTGFGALSIAVAHFLNWRELRKSSGNLML